MSIDRVMRAGQSGDWEMLDLLVRTEGTAAMAHARQLAAELAVIRDLADAAHFLCLLHGRHPGLFDMAIDHSREPAVTAWIQAMAEAFAAERAYLIAIVVAAGPLPSTPGQAQSEAAVSAQRHALDMLAQSDRHGCAAGAALALALDWSANRAVLDAAATRLGVAPPPAPDPDRDAIRALLAAIEADEPGRRALRFGAHQLLAQHRGLWSLLESRAVARKS